MTNDDIRGTITDGDGSPITGAVVQLTPIDGANGDAVIYTETDTAGDYAFYRHPQGDGTTQEWHVVASYDDGSGTFNTLSKPGVTAAIEQGFGRPRTEVDFFNDGDLAEYSGDTGAFSTTSSGTIYEGSHALTFTSGNNKSIYSTSGLPTYPSRGDVISLRLYIPTSSGDTSSQYEFQFFGGNQDGYRVRFNEGAGDLILENAANATVLVSDTSVSYPIGEWLRCEIDTSAPDDITVTLGDLTATQIAQITATDGTHDSGGIGFGNSDDSGTEVRFDAVGLVS